MLSQPDDQQLRKIDDVMDETTRRSFRQMLGLRPQDELPWPVAAAWYRCRVLYDRIGSPSPFSPAMLAMIVTMTGVEDVGESRPEWHTAVAGDTPEITEEQKVAMAKMNALTAQWDAVKNGTVVDAKIDMTPRKCRFQKLSADTGFVTLSTPSGKIVDVPFADATLPSAEEESRKPKTESKEPEGESKEPEGES